MDRCTENIIPSWKRDILMKRREQESYRRRHTDVLESRLCDEREVKSPTKTADIIKFFNTVADGVDISGSEPRSRYLGSDCHLAPKPGIKIAPVQASRTSVRTGMYRGQKGVPCPPASQAVRSPGENPNRRGDSTHLPTRLSHQQAEVNRGEQTVDLHSFPSQFAPLASRSKGTYQLHFVESDSSEIVSEDEDEPAAAEAVTGWPVKNRNSADLLTVGSIQHMGEEKRLFLSNGRSEVDPRGLGGVGSRLHRSRQVAGKRHVGGRDSIGAGGGDSDGMMGSGGESDSSEEIHYGPGFVSRLKSRYMSVALRGSARGSLGTLRRTASLEDFLELERGKQDEDPEIISPPSHKYTRASSIAAPPAKVFAELL